MFSGIVELQGRLLKRNIQGKRVALTFQSRAWKTCPKRGESIAVDGVCLTVVGVPTKTRFKVQVVHETLIQTTLSQLKVRDSVNLERSLKWGERIGGHFVLGHVDAVGHIINKKGRGKSFILEIMVPSELMQQVVPKGSIAVNGVSLTIQSLKQRSIKVAIVPHTAKCTSLGKKKKGNKVNLEIDVIAKHLARLVKPSKQMADAFCS
jgi:riboflavin synthase